MNNATICALVAAILLAGCSGAASNTNDEPKGPTQADVNRAKEAGYRDGYAAAEAKYNPPTVEVSNRTTRSTLDVDPGHMLVFNIGSSSKDVTLTYSVLQYGGPRFDLVVQPNPNTPLCEPGCLVSTPGGDIPDQFDDCSDWDTGSVKRTCTLPAGSWQIIIDNTQAGGAEPDPAGDDETLRLRLTYAATALA